MNKAFTLFFFLQPTFGKTPFKERYQQRVVYETLRRYSAEEDYSNVRFGIH